MADPCPVPRRDEPCQLNECITDPPTPASRCPVGCEIGPCKPEERAELARRLRYFQADQMFSPRSHPCNCDEITYWEKGLGFIASFTKGLPHDDLGIVDPGAYCRLLTALATGEPEAFENVPLGCCTDCPCPSPAPPTDRDMVECRVRRRQLENPQAAFAYDLQGADSHALCMPPAPAFDSAEQIAEIAENYWMALARDIPFTHYDTHPAIAAAAADLSAYKCFFGPTDPANLFRGFTPGEQVGPYVSQFFFMDTPYGAQFIPAQIRTVLPGIDYVTSYLDWLAVQDGCDRDQMFCDPVPRYIRNGRDLGQYVHVDLTFNAFLNAGMILQSARDPLRRCEARAGLGVEYAGCLPYVNPAAPFEEQFRGKSASQIGFATFGMPHLINLLLEAMERALKAVWFQKWGVHRRLRPEEFGGRIHNNETGAASYPFHAGNYAQLQSVILPRIYDHNRLQNRNRRRFPEKGTYLLPQAFAEGSPIHPSYGAGHATVAGACATILKAWFPGEHLIANPAVPTDDGLALQPFRPGEDFVLTVEGEINKLAANISLGRNIAGVHWRSDHAESMLLGEEVAIQLLCDQRNLYNEPYEWAFNRFDGTQVRIRPGEERCPSSDDARLCTRTRTPFICAPSYAIAEASRDEGDVKLTAEQKFILAQPPAEVPPATDTSPQPDALERPGETSATSVGTKKKHKK